MRGKIGFLGHEPLLYRDLTARENLRFHARLHGVAVRAHRRAARGGRACARGPTIRCTRTRAGWCSAPRSAARCCTRRQLLLLDEPLAGLDPGAAALVEPLISGGTRVVISHDSSASAATSRSGCAAGGSALLRARASRVDDVRALYA